MRPLVSVLICTRDRKDMLAQALDSLDAQTFRDFETVVVDDGSTDGTEELKYRITTYEHTPKRGISAARNRCLELMRGDYFFVMDSDDSLAPSCLQEHVDAIGGYDLVFPDFEYFGEGMSPGSVESYHAQDFSWCYRTKKVPHPGLYRSSTLRRFRYDESLDSAVDYDYILTILSEFPQIRMAALRKPLYLYRVNHRQERNSPRQVAAVGKVRQKHSKK